jgi:hypothetical protein
MTSRPEDAGVIRKESPQVRCRFYGMNWPPSKPKGNTPVNTYNEVSLCCRRHPMAVGSPAIKGSFFARERYHENKSCAVTIEYHHPIRIW